MAGPSGLADDHGILLSKVILRGLKSLIGNEEVFA